MRRGLNTLRVIAKRSFEDIFLIFKFNFISGNFGSVVFCFGSLVSCKVEVGIFGYKGNICWRNYVFFRGVFWECGDNYVVFGDF